MSNATELLRRALDVLVAQDETICAEFCGMQTWCSPPIIEEIIVYLDAEPEAEPVAWGYKDRSGEISACISRQSAEDAGTQGDYKIPLYTRPEPKRKPMTEEEIDAAYDDCIDLEGYYLLEAGIRFAEKHHGIGGSDE